MSQPSLAPVKPNGSRTRSKRVIRGSTSALRSIPLTLSETVFFIQLLNSRGSVPKSVPPILHHSNTPTIHFPPLAQMPCRRPDAPKFRRSLACMAPTRVGRRSDRTLARRSCPLEQPYRVQQFSHLDFLPPCSRAPESRRRSQARCARLESFHHRYLMSGVPRHQRKACRLRSCWKSAGTRYRTVVDTAATPPA